MEREATKYTTPYGTGLLIWHGDRLARHYLPKRWPLTTGPMLFPNPQARPLTLRLESYFQGEKIEFSPAEIPIDWSFFGPFEQKVARALAAVPYGSTISYAELAAATGNPRACRAVGNCMAKNPYPLLLPCHRVIRSDGSLGNFSSGGDWKLRLLELEGVRL